MGAAAGVGGGGTIPPGLCFGESIAHGSSISQRLHAIPPLCDSTRTPTPLPRRKSSI